MTDPAPEANVTQSDREAALELFGRAAKQIKLGKMTGAHTGNPLNIYQIAEELLAALQEPIGQVGEDG